MKPYFDDGLVQLDHGDCLAVLRTLPDESVDAVVTDPPYGLSNTDPKHVAETLTKWVTGDHEYTPPAKGGFMGKTWDSFVPPPAVWIECMRVLKPGGHLLVFAGTRTQDLMGLSIRLAGFDIRDGIGWIYGSGFPKSMDVSKAIDKVRDDHPEIRIVCRAIRAAMDAKGMRSRDLVEHFDECHPRLIDHWAARDTDSQPSLPKWDQWQTLRELLDLPDDMDAEVWRLNGRKGSPGENWGRRDVLVARQAKDRRSDGTVIGLGHAGSADITAPATPEAERWSGWGTALKPAIEPVIVARKPLAGTVAGNVLEWGTGALNIDASRVGTGEDTSRTPSVVGDTSAPMGRGIPMGGRGHSAGRWPANVLLDPEAAAAMDEQSGAGVSRKGKPRKSKAPGDGYGMTHTGAEYDDSGGASRFFPVFKYQAKAPKRERPVIEQEDGTKVAHPTVKPLALMEWLVTLITPPGGVVLDPFAGSGTTLQAARDKGFRSIGIEADADYVALIRERLEQGSGEPDLRLSQQPLDMEIA